MDYLAITTPALRLMHQTLRQLISEEDFASLWLSDVPDYNGFIDALAKRLSACLSEQAERIQLSYKLTSTNRVRIEGTCVDDSEPTAFYSEIVWLRTSRTYRGEAHSRKIPPPPVPKTIDEFVLALLNMSEDADLIVSAQAYLATEGLMLDASSGLPEHALAAIFDTFEKFPDEEFSALALLLTPSDHLAQHALQSLRRRPSWATIECLAGLLRTKKRQDAHDLILQELRNVAESTQCENYLREMASSLV